MNWRKQGTESTPIFILEPTLKQPQWVWIGDTCTDPAGKKRDGFFEYQYLKLPGLAGSGVEIREIWSFIGLRIGDRVEAEIALDLQGGVPFYRRGPHKETDGIYDAWHYHKPPLGAPQTRGLHVYLNCLCTHWNKITDNPAEKDAALVHFGLIVVGRIPPYPVYKTDWGIEQVSQQLTDLADGEDLESLLPSLRVGGTDE